MPKTKTTTMMEEELKEEGMIASIRHKFKSFSNFTNVAIQILLWFVTNLGWREVRSIRLIALTKDTSELPIICLTAAKNALSDRYPDITEDFDQLIERVQTLINEGGM